MKVQTILHSPTSPSISKKLILIELFQLESTKIILYIYIYKKSPIHQRKFDLGRKFSTRIEGKTRIMDYGFNRGWRNSTGVEWGWKTISNTKMSSSFKSKYYYPTTPWLLLQPERSSPPPYGSCWNQYVHQRSPFFLSYIFFPTLTHLSKIIWMTLQWGLFLKKKIIKRIYYLSKGE